MGILDSLGKAASNTAQKTKEVAETAKINMSINGKESDITKVYTAIGELVYNQHRENLNIEVENLCGSIDTIKEEITELRKKLIVLRKLVICPSCDAENAEEAKFCAKCGAGLQKLEPAAEEITGVVCCKSCNAENALDAKFCCGCGSAMQ